jgi:diguanylate cyclase (GGDEF)-like protein
MRTEETTLFQTIGLILLMALAYNVTGILSATLLSQNAVAIISAFIPEGIALAGVLIYGTKIIPGIFIGQLLLAQFEWSNSLASFAIALINSLEAYFAYKLFYYFKLHKDLKTLKDIGGLFVIIIFIAQPSATILNNIALLYTHIISSDEFITNSFSWWFGNIMGQILFAPLLLLLYSNQKNIDFRYIIAYALATGVYTYIIQTYIPINNISLLLLLTLPISIYISTKNLVYGLVVSVSFAMCNTYITHLNIGLFTKEPSPIDNIIDLNYFILSHIILVLLIGTLFREKEEAIAELKSMAHFDYLTGLPNRHLLREEIHHSVLMAEDYHQKSAICYIDLDGFKQINDTLGHHIGDETLKNVVARVQPFLETKDVLLRIGGDEFLLILNEIRDDELDTRLNLILKAVREPMSISNHTINISFSIGVSICPIHGTTVKDLMSAADNAMYKAKELGKNCIYYAK